MVTNDQVKRYVAENLTRILNSRGMTQKALAKMAGEDEMTISRLCRRQVSPNVAVMVRIADALEVSVDKLTSKPSQKGRRNAG